MTGGGVRRWISPDFGKLAASKRREAPHTKEAGTKGKKHRDTDGTGVSTSQPRSAA